MDQRASLGLLSLFVFSLAFATLSPSKAHAYAWMIRHDYTGCGTCHADPSGGGLLTAYGRAQSDLLLRMRYGKPAGEEPDKTSEIAWGVLPQPPEWLNVGAAFRGATLFTKLAGAKMTSDFLLMQADARAEIRLGGFRANASLGAVTSEAPADAIASSFISREHWLGYAFADDTVLLRAGRINMPYGIRSIEHTLYVRRSTRTDINDSQQHGVALSYSGELIRAEIMGIAGNYQLHPDAFRERGYSGYAEIAVSSWAAVGVSSLITHAKRDIYKGVATTRQAHGLFARVAPVPMLVFLVEGDFVGRASEGAKTQLGYAGMLQADVEPMQGLHVIATAETYYPGSATSGNSWNGWFGIDWFFLPHADLRVDLMRGSIAAGDNFISSTAYLAQLHVFL